ERAGSSSVKFGNAAGGGSPGIRSNWPHAGHCPSRLRRVSATCNRFPQGHVKVIVMGFSQDAWRLYHRGVRKRPRFAASLATTRIKSCSVEKCRLLPHHADTIG